jgi:hypothetical protein
MSQITVVCRSFLYDYRRSGRMLESGVPVGELLCLSLMAESAMSHRVKFQ